MSGEDAQFVVVGTGHIFLCGVLNVNTTAQVALKSVVPP